MSTRIYDAWFTTKDMHSVLRSLRRLQSREEAAFRHLCKRYLIHSPDDDGPILINTAFLFARSILCGERAFNPTCQAVAYPYPYPGADGKRNSLLVQLFGVSRENTPYFVRSIKGEDFHYQNQCDQPEDVSDSEWKARKQVWNKVLLAGSGVPSEHGFSFDIITVRRALEILFEELRISIPPEKQPTQDGKLWIEWGPRSYGMFIAQDVEWAWKRGKEAFAEVKQMIVEGWLKPFTPEHQSLNSAML